MGNETAHPCLPRSKPGRNDPCPCGSGKKYKQCCERREASVASIRQSRAMHFNRGYSYRQTNRLDEAAESYRKALALDPGFADGYVNLGNVLYEQGRLDEAIENYRKALALNPDSAQAHYNLGNTLHDQDKLGEAAECYRRTITLKPNFPDTHNNLGLALQKQGEVGKAIACYQKALALKPDYAEAYSNLLFLYGSQASFHEKEYPALARGWERACVTAQERQAACRRTFKRSPPAGRRLKIGYVSGDFRQHAVSYFVEQLFAHHDHARVELVAYSNHGQRDAVTERLQALVERWVPVFGAPDAAVRDRIEADEIDVLVDLSGHSAYNRLGVFARRAAPVQAFYLGFMASTWLTEMDYWIGDAILTPPETDSHFSERVWRLPRVSVCYGGKPDAPHPGWRPDPDGTVRIGSFNNLLKLTPATFTLWAEVLRALPEARLLLKTKELADPGNRRRILDVMTCHSISAGRIELADSSTTPEWRDHLAYYDRLDIALDPVGSWGGNTTTCDALWMGVPVVTLEGERMAASPLCDARGLAESLED
ncbi:MAG: TPR repeat-containing protein, partial [Gallionellaceae bacterium]